MHDWRIGCCAEAEEGGREGGGERGGGGVRAPRGDFDAMCWGLRGGREEEWGEEGGVVVFWYVRAPCGPILKIHSLIHSRAPACHHIIIISSRLAGYTHAPMRRCAHAFCCMMSNMPVWCRAEKKKKQEKESHGGAVWCCSKIST